MNNSTSNKEIDYVALNNKSNFFEGVGEWLKWKSRFLRFK